jgi:membrane associated rhomboid family serine protease
MITLIIAAVTVITSIRAFSDQSVTSHMIFAPNYMSKHGQWYRFFSHGLIHADWTHLIFNMIAFYSFGIMVENTLVNFYPSAGRLIYLSLYVAALPVSSIFDYIKHKDNPAYMALGASGAVSAVVFASILLSPTSSIYLFLIPIPIPAYIFGPLYLLFTVYMARTATDRIAHEAHFFGAVFGLIFISIALPGIWGYFLNQIGF